MTLMLPHLIDDLEGRVKHSTLIKIPGSEHSVDNFLVLVKQAEKFSFGEIPLERNPNPKEAIAGIPVWMQPEITEVEQEAWDLGLIPLPAPICWYEYILGGEPSGCLVIGTGGEIRVQRVDYNAKQRKGVFSGVFVEKESPGQYIAHGPKPATDFIRNLHKAGKRVMNLSADHYLVTYLTLMLSSLTTDIHVVPAPHRLNKSRMKAGNAPLPPHRVVTIVPDRYVDRGPSQGGTHRSPRLHWRRSHKRHHEHRTPSAVYSPHEVHKGLTGWWITLIARQLVGKKEAGEVSHEYFVRDKETMS